MGHGEIQLAASSWQKLKVMGDDLQPIIHNQPKGYA
jgi:hypothetical protein